MRAAERPARTTYDIPGVGSLPRVTSVLNTLDKPGLLKWYADRGWDEARRQLKEAADRGTAVHGLVEVFNRSNGENAGSTSRELAPFLLAYAAWFREHVAEVVAVEQTVWSVQHGYAGQFDMALRLNGSDDVVLADLKTSKACREPHDTWRLQTSAYAIALMESAGIVCRRRIVVHLPSNRPGEIVIHELPTGAGARADWDAFRNLLEVFKWSQNR